MSIHPNDIKEGIYTLFQIMNTFEKIFRQISIKMTRFSPISWNIVRTSLQTRSIFWVCASVNLKNINIFTNLIISIFFIKLFYLCQDQQNYMNGLLSNIGNLRYQDNCKISNNLR